MNASESLTATESERRIRIAAYEESRRLLAQMKADRLDADYCNQVMQGFWREYDEAKQRRANERKADRLAYKYPRISPEERLKRGNQDRQEAQRQARLKAKYGLTLEEWAAMLEAQNEQCAICSRRFSGSFRVFVDHCHRADRVRGLLCSSCNTMLGMAHDDVQVLAAAIEYLATR